MVTELKNLHLLIDADMRLAAAAGGVAHYLADEAGLEKAAGTLLQSAVVAACKEAFAHLTLKHPHLEINFGRFPDRIEVVLSHEGDDAPAAGGQSTAGLDKNRERSSAAPALAFSGVDHVQYEARGAEMVMRLTKYLRKVAPGV